MKRSEVNALLRKAMDFFAQHGFALSRWAGYLWALKHLQLDAVPAEVGFEELFAERLLILEAFFVLVLGADATEDHGAPFRAVLGAAGLVMKHLGSLKPDFSRP
jgi:hypothetical protein